MFGKILQFIKSKFQKNQTRLELRFTDAPEKTMGTIRTLDRLHGPDMCELGPERCPFCHINYYN